MFCFSIMRTPLKGLKKAIQLGAATHASHFGDGVLPASDHGGLQRSPIAPPHISQGGLHLRLLISLSYQNDITIQVAGRSRLEARLPPKFSTLVEKTDDDYFANNMPLSYIDRVVCLREATLDALGLARGATKGVPTSIKRCIYIEICMHGNLSRFLFSPG